MGYRSAGGYRVCWRLSGLLEAIGFGRGYRVCRRLWGLLEAVGSAGGYRVCRRLSGLLEAMGSAGGCVVFLGVRSLPEAMGPDEGPSGLLKSLGSYECRGVLRPSDIIRCRSVATLPCM
jgi:hypothetical protein